LFIINITVNDNLSSEQHASLFSRHVEWFKHYFSTGEFVVIGPYVEKERAGLIIASTESRDRLMAILAEDAYYPELAAYEVHEFSPKMIAHNLHQLQVP
jgi:uncharacterized protein YciI